MQSHLNIHSPDWTLINQDPDINEPSKWVKGTWNDSQEGITMFPKIRFSNGYAYTSLEMKAGSTWNCAGFGQNRLDLLPTGKLFLNIPQRMTVRLMPYYENPGSDARFQISFEYWLESLEKTGIFGFKQGEIMLVLRSSGQDRMGPDSYYETVMPDGIYAPISEGSPPMSRWYYTGYAVEDIPFMEWTEKTFDLNKLLFDKYIKTWGINPKTTFVRDVGCLVEGFAKNGAVECVWDSVRHEAVLPT